MTGLSCRWFRFSLRTMLVLVTLVAIATVTTVQWRKRREVFEDLAVRHEAKLELVPEFRNILTGNGAPSDDTKKLDRYFHEVVAYHTRLAEKYRRATTFPFWPVEEDPPNPEVPDDLNYNRALIEHIFNYPRTAKSAPASTSPPR
jgi:hypothetical protein